MKELRITFTDREFKRVKKRKLLGESWHAYILRISTDGD